MLKGKNILIGVTGSIAAYKIPILVRLLIKEGAEVKVILTNAAKDFVTPLTLSTLTGHPVLNEFYDKTDGSWNSHVDLGNWADVYLLAPVSANTLGKLANGLADNLLTATYLAAKCPVLLAPAMDVDMFNHPTTSNNIEKLKSFGNIIIEPEEGELASGLCGAGRMQEPENIHRILHQFFQKKKDFNKLKVLISAGPTYEAIDPVRYIGNHSSGRMGFALAEEFSRRGANVDLVAGPIKLDSKLKNVNITKVITADEMHKACTESFPGVDIAIMSAAVADYTPEFPEKRKIKKRDGKLTIILKNTKDILLELGENKRKGQILVGFALETDNEIKNAKTKLKNKHLDLIVLNSLQDKGAGFGHDTNKIVLIDNKNMVESFDLKSKSEVAGDIADKISSLYYKMNK